MLTNEDLRDLYQTLLGQAEALQELTTKLSQDGETSANGDLSVEVTASIYQASQSLAKAVNSLKETLGYRLANEFVQRGQVPPCHSRPKEEWCDKHGPGGFMGHTCYPIPIRPIEGPK